MVHYNRIFVSMHKILLETASEIPGEKKKGETVLLAGRLKKEEDLPWQRLT